MEIRVGLDQRRDFLQGDIQPILLDLLEDACQQRLRAGIGIARGGRIGGGQRAAQQQAGGCRERQAKPQGGCHGPHQLPMRSCWISHLPSCLTSTSTLLLLVLSEAER